MSFDDEHTTWTTLRPDEYPLLIEFIAVRTDEVVHTVLINGPGVAEVPALSGKYGPIHVRLTYGNGRVENVPPPP